MFEYLLRLFFNPLAVIIHHHVDAVGYWHLEAQSHLEHLLSILLDQLGLLPVVIAEVVQDAFLTLLATKLMKLLITHVRNGNAVFWFGEWNAHAHGLILSTINNHDLILSLDNFCHFI